MLPGGRESLSRGPWESVAPLVVAVLPAAPGGGVSRAGEGVSLPHPSPRSGLGAGVQAAARSAASRLAGLETGVPGGPAGGATASSVARAPRGALRLSLPSRPLASRPSGSAFSGRPPPCRAAPRSERRRRRSPLTVRWNMPTAARGRPGSGPDRRCPRRPFPRPRRARRRRAGGRGALPVNVRRRRAGERGASPPASSAVRLRAGEPACGKGARARGVGGGPGRGEPLRARWLALSGGSRAVRVAGSEFRRCPLPARGVGRARGSPSRRRGA